MRATKRNLRNQLLTAADNVYWRRLRHVCLGYNMCSIQDMLNHLIESYGRFTETERKEVTSRMEVPWEGGPLEFVIQQISDAADAFALAGTPLSAQQQTDKLYDLVKESGLLSDACQRWRMFPTADKTWAAATAHFQQYANDRDEELTTETAGYQRANHAQTKSNTGHRYAWRHHKPACQPSCPRREPKPRISGPSSRAGRQQSRVCSH